MVLCVCGKDFANEENLRTRVRHERCRGPPRNDEGTCLICDEEFRTFAGMRQHMRRTHPEEYNEELEARYEHQEEPAPLWFKEDLHRMAREEVRFTGRFVNQFLVEHVPGRNIDFIKNRRRDARYKELVSHLRNNPEEPPPLQEALGQPLRVVADERPEVDVRPYRQLRVVLQRYELLDDIGGGAVADMSSR